MYVVLCVWDSEEVKFATCRDTDTNVDLYDCWLQVKMYFLKIF